MSLFLRWRDTSEGTKEWYIVNMFKSLSSRWYPVNVIGSSIYDILEMYAEELVLLNSEVFQIFQDLDVESSRSGSIGSQTASKTYQNFGSLLESNKLFDQSFDTYTASASLQGYRERLRLSMFAYTEGSSIAGLQKLGGAYSGVLPLVEEPFKSSYRWSLTTYSGSVSEVGERFFIPNVFFSHIGSIIPDDRAQIPYNSASVIAPGDSIVESFSKLGNNTKLSGRQERYHSVGVMHYINASASVSTKNSITNAFINEIKADQTLRESYSDKFVYYRMPQVDQITPINEVLSISPLGYAYNISKIPFSGSILTTDVLQLPSDYQNYDWYYDWLIVKEENALYEISIRDYPINIIPSTVYYKTYNTEKIEIISTNTTSKKAHWLFTNINNLWDVTGNLNNLVAEDPITASASVNRVFSRDLTRPCLRTISPIIWSASSSVPSLNLQESMYAEMWIHGLDSSIVGDTEAFSISNTDDSGDYYSFIIDSFNGNLILKFQVSGVPESASASIINYLLEEPERPHYFAATYASGSVFFYADNNLLNSGSISLNPPNITAGNVKIKSAGDGIILDEVVLSEGFLTKEDASDHFLNTLPRIAFSGISSGSVENQYYQAKFILYANGPKDIEFHQFSMKGDNSQLIYKVLNKKNSKINKFSIFPPVKKEFWVREDGAFMRDELNRFIVWR